jgi:hypothetical protein
MAPKIMGRRVLDGMVGDLLGGKGFREFEMVMCMCTLGGCGLGT